MGIVDDLVYAVGSHSTKMIRCRLILTEVTRQQLIVRVAEATGQSQADVDRVYEILIENVTAALAAGEKVEMRGIGIFEVKATPARRGRNPKTGELFDIPEGRRIAFRPGSDLKKKIVGPRLEVVAATQAG